MPNRTHTDSITTEYHEDGSYTETSVQTITPMSKTQQGLAIGGVALLAVAPVLPLLALAALEKFEDKRQARKDRKAAKKSD